MIDALSFIKGMIVFWVGALFGFFLRTLCYLMDG